jgi:hypothetical protein
MAYGKLAEGNRVLDFVNSSYHDAADFNEIEDQLKVMCGPRWISCFPPVIAEPTAHGAGLWDVKAYLETNFTMVLEHTTSSSDLIYSPMPGLRVGEKITGIEVVYSGDTSITPSSTVSFVYQERGNDAAYVETQLFSTYSTANAGALWADKVIVTYTASPLPLVIQDNYHYMFWIYSPAQAYDVRIFDLRVRTQFGN